MSNPINLARNVFRVRYTAALKQLRATAPQDPPSPEVFELNMDNSARVAAYDAVVEAVARALGTQDLLKIRATLRRAHIEYVPAHVEHLPDGNLIVNSAYAEITA